METPADFIRSRHQLHSYSLGILIEWKLKRKSEELASAVNSYSLGILIEWKLAFSKYESTLNEKFLLARDIN